jgi:hypothetical protein
MKIRIVMPLVGIVVLTACAPPEKTPDERVLLDETVPLTRQADVDVATRDLPVDSDAVVVAIVDENLTDVRVTLASTGKGKVADQLVDVENHPSTWKTISRAPASRSRRSTRASRPA